MLKAEIRDISTDLINTLRQRYKRFSNQLNPIILCFWYLDVGSVNFLTA